MTDQQQAEYKTIDHPYQISMLNVEGIWKKENLKKKI